MLDLSRVCTHSLLNPDWDNQGFHGFTGEQRLDGLPFDLRRHGTLYGSKEARSSKKEEHDYPDFVGVKVGRRFDELHLLHTAHWNFVEGEPIAIIRFRYADGSERQLPILYGHHLRDWQHLFSEETESLLDPNSKLVWRGQSLADISTSTRLFKSRLVNPEPGKEVTELDFLTTRSYAAYDLFAATVAAADPARSVTPPVEPAAPAYKFDGECEVIVLDADTGEPLPRALIETGYSRADMGAIGLPVRTDAEGKAVIRYPRGKLEYCSGIVSRKGYESEYIGGEGSFPEQATVRLRRSIEDSEP